MKKLLIAVLIVFAIVAVYERYSIILGMLGVYPGSFKEHKMINEIVVNYDTSETPYNHYGIYREIYRKYNYIYYDSVYNIGERLDDMHGRDYYVNEYGDTVLIIYTDYTNYPRRKD